MIIHIIGARPNFMKCAVVYKALEKRGVKQFIIHTGQHYDTRLSENILKELEIVPNINLEIEASHYSDFIKSAQFDIQMAIPSSYKTANAKIIVYGDTSSTLAGTLAATQVNLPLYHVEAGLRSFNWTMPEERIRVTTDMLSDILFAPTQTAVSNLEREDLKGRIEFVGDTTYDAFLMIENKLNIKPVSDYVFCTLHRPQNVDNQERLLEIIDSLSKVGQVIIPVHHRLKKALEDFQLFMPSNIKQIEPLGYQKTLEHIASARIVCTDSAGVLKESYFLRRPCITVRTETEYPETLDQGWNYLANPKEIHEIVKNHPEPDLQYDFYGDGTAGEKIAKIIME